MKNKIKLSKLTITTANNKKIELSIEEAEELYCQLEKLFGIKMVTKEIIHKHDYYYPWIWPQLYTVTYSDTGDSGNAMYSTDNVTISWNFDCET